MSDQIDDAIDRAVREMLDVEPPAGLRGRVMDRIEGRAASAFHPALVASAFKRKIWISAPLAAAAVVVLAVWGPWRQAPTVMVPAAPPSIARVEPPADVFLPGAPRDAAGTTHAPPFVQASRTARTAPGDAARIAAAAVAEDTSLAEDFPRIPALSVPELVVPAIRTVAAVDAPAQLSVAPIPAPAPIEIEPLSTSPRERQFQE